MSNKDIVPSAKDLAEAGSSSARHSNKNVVPTQNNNDQNNQDGANDLDPERIQELETHRIMHEFVYQAPIADHFLNALLPLVNLVHFCLVFDYAFDWLREHDNRVEKLCTSFDFLEIYHEMPSFNTVQEIIKRFKPSQIKFGHKNRADTFPTNILRAFNASGKTIDTLFIKIRNPLQIIKMYEISVNELTVKCDSFFPNVGTNPLISVLRSVHMNVKSIILDGCTIDGFVIERFRDFDLEQLRLLNCETHLLHSPNAFFRQLTFYTKLTTLHIRCTRAYYMINLNMFMDVLMDKINQLSELEDLEITIGTLHTSIEPIRTLQKLKRLQINIELSSAQFEIPDIMEVIQRTLKHVLDIEIKLFTMSSSLRTNVTHNNVARQIQDMNIPNVKVTRGFPFQDDDT